MQAQAKTAPSIYRSVIDQ